MNRRRVVIGLGNPWRGDDAAGCAVAQAVATRQPGTGSPIEVRVLDGEPARLLDAWDGADVAIVVDAVRTGAKPGTVQLLDVPAPDPGPSSHGLGLADAVALAARLDRLPRRLHVVGVEGSQFADGSGLSPSVAQAVPAAARLVCELLEEDDACA